MTMDVFIKNDLGYRVERELSGQEQKSLVSVAGVSMGDDAGLNQGGGRGEVRILWMQS